GTKRSRRRRVPWCSPFSAEGCAMPPARHSVGGDAVDRVFGRSVEVDEHLADGALLDGVVSGGDVVEGEVPPWQLAQRSSVERSGDVTRGLEQVGAWHAVEQEEAQHHVR